MFARVMYTTVLVRDQSRALDFYTGNFGFVKRIDAGGPGARFLTMGFQGQDIEVILWPVAQGEGSPSVDTADVSAGLTQIEPGELFLESDDLRGDFETLRLDGVQFVEATPEDYPIGVRVTALDPDGNRISLRQPRS